MSTTTTNLGLTLPAGTDPADIAVLNTNFTTIDTFAGQQTAKDTAQDARMTAIENEVTDQDSRLTALETSDTTQNGRLTAIETKNTTQDSRLTALETSDTTQNSRLTAIETKNTAQDGRLTTLEQTDTTHAARLTAIEAKDTAQDTTIAKLVDDGAKNLLKNTAPYGDLVRTNITFTHNDDDTYAVNANNANTANTDLYVAANIPIKAGTYVLSGCPEGGNNTNTFKLQITGIGYDLGDGCTFTITQDTTISVYIRIWNGYVPNDLIFRPMICTAEDHAASDAFVPYTLTLRELYEMIQELQAGGGTA